MSITVDLFAYARVFTCIHAHAYRYMVSDRCKASFTQVRLLLDGYLLSPSCPGFISGAYSKAVAYAWSYVDPEQQKQSAEQTQSMMSKCSIM